MKKILAILFVVLVVLSVAFTGFKSDTNLKEVTFWTLQMSDFDEYISKIIREYEKNHPNVKIKWIDVPFSEGEKRTLAAVMTDNPPDLINLNPDFSAMLAQKGTLEAIDEKVVKRFNQEIIASLKYNGVLYSIPWYATSAITIYNKELFSKTGIIRLPRTFDELASISRKIKDKTGVYAFLPTITENDTMVRIFNKYGVQELEDYNSKKAVKVLNLFETLYEKDLIPKESITFTHREALEQYMAGKIVFFLGGSNFLKMIEENAPSVFAQTDVAEQIKGDLGQNDFSVMNFVIPKRAKYKKEALDFCLYLTNTENQLELAKKTNIIATDLEALNDKFYNEQATLEAKARYYSAKQINNINPVLRQKRGQKEINTMLNTLVQSVLLQKISAEDALNNFVKKY